MLAKNDLSTPNEVARLGTVAASFTGSVGESRLLEAMKDAHDRWLARTR